VNHNLERTHVSKTTTEDHRFHEQAGGSMENSKRQVVGTFGSIKKHAKTDPLEDPIPWDH
jgi:hypothetical protein